MENNALRKEPPAPSGDERKAEGGGRTAELLHGFQLRPVRTVHGKNGHIDESLRMYTEEEVSGILQVSLSQLRKWRMKKNHGNGQGPPFRKFGRLVRYPAQGLQAYINGEDRDSRTQE